MKQTTILSAQEHLESCVARMEAVAALEKYVNPERLQGTWIPDCAHPVSSVSAALTATQTCPSLQKRQRKQKLSISMALQRQRSCIRRYRRCWRATAR